MRLRGENYGYRLAVLAFLLGLLSGAMYAYSRGVLVRDQIEDFGASRTQISLAFTAVQIVGTLFAPVLGYLVDRYPLRRIMALGAVWLGVGFLAMSQAGTLFQFAVLISVFVSLGTNGIGTLPNTRMMVEWFDRNRGLALAVAIMGYSTAGVVTPPVALYMVKTIGWRHTYVVFAGLCLLVVLPLIVLFVRQRTRTAAEGLAASAGHLPGVEPGSYGSIRDATVSGDALRFRLRTYLEFVRSPQFWSAVIVFGLMSGAYSGFSLHLFLHYTDTGISDAQAAALLSFTAIVAVISKPLGGWLVDRFGARTATLALVGGCAMAMVSYALAGSIQTLYVSGALFGLTFGGFVPVQAALFSRLFPDAAFGRVYGSARLCMFPVVSGWTPLIGYVHDVTGSYLAMFRIGATVFLIAGILVYAMLPRSFGSGPVTMHRAAG